MPSSQDSSRYGVDEVHPQNYFERMGSATLLSSIASTPTVVKTLMQLGFEPCAPKPYTNILGQTGFIRPGLFSYTNILVKTHGYGILFTGLPCRIVETILYDSVSSRVKRGLDQILHRRAATAIDDDDDDESAVQNIVSEIFSKSVSMCIASLVCQPFKVVGTRMIAQIAGKEMKYAGMIQGLSLIYNEDGLRGLFRGLVPTCVGEVVFATSIVILSDIVGKYITPHLMGYTKETADANGKAVSNMITHHLAVTCAQPLFYPFHVVRAVMIVNGSGLSVAQPSFESFVDCFRHLASLPSHRGLMRGSSMLRRFTTKE
eukprot:m.919364 g.919364  ORF g.919364 m.919364 type:complete len:317 (-) comp23751_c0_seq1:3081-4031(-)